jgi:Family of unknown function (DUF6502)
MLEDSTLVSAIGLALAKLLRPLVRLLLKHSFPYSAFESIAKRVYVETAMADFALPGKKPSISRAAILTGLTRKDVNLLLAEPSSRADLSGAYYNRAARVLTAWVREPRFAGLGESPQPLPIDGPDGFGELVRLHGGDVPTRAVLDELQRVGAVQVLADGRVALRQRAYVPQDSMVQKLGILGTDVGELIETITHNIEHGATDARYQRKVMHVGIPVDALPAFREMSARQSQALLEDLDAWLTEHDIEHLPESGLPPGDTARVGVGIHYFEQLTSKQESQT